MHREKTYLHSASGYSVHMVVDGVFSNPSTSVPNPTTIVMEYPINGKGCVNSEVVFSNTLNDPWILNGASLIDDLNPGISSYTFNSNPVYTSGRPKLDAVCWL